MINNIKNENISLTNREYLKLLFTYEDKAKNLLVKRASKLWWLNKNETIVKCGQSSFHFALKR